MDLWRVSKESADPLDETSAAEGFQRASSLYVAIDKPEKAADEMDNALRLYRKRMADNPDDPSGYLELTECLLRSAEIQRRLNRPSQLLASCQEAAQVCRNLVGRTNRTYVPHLGTALKALAAAFQEQGDYGAVLGVTEEGLSLLEQPAGGRSADLQFDVAALNLLRAQALSELLRYDAARDHCLRALSVSEPSPGGRPEMQESTLKALILLSALECRQADYESAYHKADQAVSLARGFKEEQWLVLLAMGLALRGDISQVLNRRGEAYVDYLEAVGIYRHLGTNGEELCRQKLARSLAVLGNICVQLNDSKHAVQYLEESLAVESSLVNAGRSDLRVNVARCLSFLAAVYQIKGETGLSRQRLSAALDLVRELGTGENTVAAEFLARIKARLAHVAMQLGQMETAHSLYEEVMPRFLCPGEGLLLFNWGERMTVFAGFALLLLRRDDVPAAERHRQAFEFFKHACQTSERLRSKFLDEGHRSRILTESIELLEAHVHNCFHCWQDEQGRASRPPFFLQEAVLASERLRTRRLLDRLALENMAAQRAGPDWASRLQRLDKAISTLIQRTGQSQEDSSLDVGFGEAGKRLFCELEGHPRSEDTRTAVDLNRIGEEIDRLERERQLVLHELESHASKVLPLWEKLDVCWERIAGLLSRDCWTAVIHFTVCSDDTLAMLIPAAEDDPIPVLLPRFGSQRCSELAIRLQVGYARCRDLGVHSYSREWQAVLAEIMPILAEEAILPVLDRLPSHIERLVVVPHLNLHLFPMHLCPLGGQKLLLDRFEVVYAPSLSFLLHCARRCRN